MAAKSIQKNFDGRKICGLAPKPQNLIFYKIRLHGHILCALPKSTKNVGGRELGPIFFILRPNKEVKHCQNGVQIVDRRCENGVTNV